MNKQSNTYTIVYASVMVILVAAVLAVTSLSLKDKQTRNIEIDKMKQILSSVHIAATADDAQTLYKKYIVDSFVLDDRGGHVDGVDAFAVDVAVQVKLPADRRQLPVLCAASTTGSRNISCPCTGLVCGALYGGISQSMPMAIPSTGPILLIRERRPDWGLKSRPKPFRDSSSGNISSWQAISSRLPWRKRAEAARRGRVCRCHFGRDDNQ